MFGCYGKLGQTENIFSVDRKIRDPITLLTLLSLSFSFTRTPHNSKYSPSSLTATSTRRSSPPTVSFPFPFLNPIHGEFISQSDPHTSNPSSTKADPHTSNLTSPPIHTPSTHPLQKPIHIPSNPSSQNPPSNP